MCGIIMLVFGIVTLVRGQFMLTRGRIVRGGPAYIIGSLLILPLPLAFAAGVVLAAVILTVGDPASQRQFDDLATVIGLLIPFACLIAAVGVAIAYAEPLEKKWAPERPRRDGGDRSAGPPVLEPWDGDRPSPPPDDRIRP